MKQIFKKALITGITGQDGSYLAEYLLKQGYQVSGLVRRLSNNNFQNLKYIQDKVELIYGDLTDNASIDSIFSSKGFDEVYNLGAQSSPAESYRQPFLTANVTGLGAHRIFDSVFRYSKGTKIYQASTSEMFGNTTISPQNEWIPFNPSNPYACAKLYAHQIAKIYREKGLFVSCGILFNHESERRGLQFITQKIAYGVACIHLGIKNSVELNEENEPIVKNGKIKVGNLDSLRDWGYAPDFVKAMHLLLQQKKADDYVVATGVQKSIRDLCQTAFAVVDINNWEDYIEVDKRFVRKDTASLLGNASRINVLGWKAETDFKAMIEKMVKHNIGKLM